MKRAALAALALLCAASAQAQQFPQSLPSNTVLGRLGVGPGPVQQIPFSSLGPNLITNFLAVTAPLTISGLNLSITGAQGRVLYGSPAAFTFAPQLGLASTSTGSLTFANSGNVGTVTLRAPSTATTWNLTFPTTAGSNGQSLITDGSGNTSWAAGTGTVNSGTSGQLGYYATTAAAISGNANLNVSAGALTIGVATSVQGSLLLAGSTSGTTTLAAPVAGTGTMTLQAGSDTLVGRATTDTLTNKTLSSPTITGPAITGGTAAGITAFSILDASASFNVAIAANSVSTALTSARTLTLDVGNVAHTVKFGTTANTITFPTGGNDTVAMLTAGQSLLNKSISSSTYEGLTVSTTTGTLTLTNGKTLAAQNTITLAAGADGQTFTFPSATDTIAGIAASQTFTNKTLTAPTINGGTAQALTNLGIRSTGSGAFDLVVKNTENLTAQRTLTVTVENANRLIDMSGDLTLAAAFTTAGGNPLTLTTTGSTNVTLPTSGTLATQNTANTFSATNTFSALQQFTDIKFSSGKLYPTSDSTTALQITKADGTTRVMDFDTTNARVGINKTPGAFDLDVNGAANFGGAITFPTSTITGLTVNNSPSSSNDYLLYYSAADSAIRKCTVGSCAAAATAGVSSLNGLTGGLTITNGGGLSVSAASTTVTLTAPVARPGGRLSLANGAPVHVSTATAASTLFYQCYEGANTVPYWNGTADSIDTIASCSVNTAMQASSTGVLNSGGVFDVWWEGNTNHNICVATNGSGGGWASDTAGSNTARGTGYSQLNTTTRPYITNTNAIATCYNGSTNYGSIAANKATYLGTICTDSGAAGVVSYTFGTSASGGGAARFCVWNAYNRVNTSTKVTDSASSWSVASNTIQSKNTSTTNRVTFVVGIQEDWYTATLMGVGTSGAATNVGGGIGYDSTSTVSGMNTVAGTSITGPFSAADKEQPLGLHFFQALDVNTAGASSTVYGGAGSPTYQPAMQADVRN